MAAFLAGLGQIFKVIRDRAIDGHERFDHALGHCACGPNAVLARNHILAPGIEKSNYLVVPGRFPVPYQEFPVHSAAAVVIDQHWNKLILNGPDQHRVGQDFATELAHTGAPGYFLEKNQHGLAFFGASSQGRIKVSAPMNVTDFDGVFSRLATIGG
jgi:hypothetical protein